MSPATTVWVRPARAGVPRTSETTGALNAGATPLGLTAAAVGSVPALAAVGSLRKKTTAMTMTTAMPITRPSLASLLMTVAAHGDWCGATGFRDRYNYSRRRAVA